VLVKLGRWYHYYWQDPILSQSSKSNSSPSSGNAIATRRTSLNGRDQNAFLDVFIVTYSECGFCHKN